MDVCDLSDSLRLLCSSLDKFGSLWNKMPPK